MDAMLNLPERELGEEQKGKDDGSESGDTTIDEDDENEAGDEGRGEDAE
jgi:hypothetical protein